MKIGLLIIVIIALAVTNLFVGSVSIPPSQVIDILSGGLSGTPAAYIVMGSRVPMVVTSCLAGAGLAASGLLLQTTFRNPLAGPSVLGVNSGAGLGVAIVMLTTGGTLTVGSMSLVGHGAIIASAFIGSMAVMLLLMAMSSVLRNTLMLLIAGIMVGYLASAVIMLLNYTSTANGIQSYVMWGMSSFNGVTLDRLQIFSVLTVFGIVMSLLLVKPLNLFMLGDNYAANLGVNVSVVRNVLLTTTGLLVAVITAYCGPVSFLGLAVPHIARLIFPTDNHRILLPATLLTGAAIALSCNLICVLPHDTVMPLNAVTPLIGAPVVVWVLIKSNFRS